MSNSNIEQISLFMLINNVTKSVVLRQLFEIKKV